MTRLLMTADAVGGVWQYATELAAALRLHGVETTIAVLGPSGTPSPFRGCAAPSLSHWEREGARSPQASGKGEGDAGVDIVETGLPLDWLATDPAQVAAAGDAIAALAEDMGADIVHLNSPALAAATRFPAPVVAVAHGCIGTWWRAARGTAPDAAYAWHADLMAAGLRAADAVVAPSAAFAADLQRTYALSAPPSVVHNGRTAPVSAPDTPPAPPADAVFTAGRLWDEVKATPLLDQVAARIDAPFRAAGPLVGPQGQGVEVRHLHHLGTLGDAALARELAARPIFVSAARFEPFGLAVLEAAAAGCPLVLSDLDTFRELWTGAALLVPGDDPAAFAASIDRLRADPALRAHLGEAARTRAARYTPAAMAVGMASIYASLRGEGRRVAA